MACAFAGGEIKFFSTKSRGKIITTTAAAAAAAAAAATATTRTQLSVESLLLGSLSSPEWKRSHCSVVIIISLPYIVWTKARTGTRKTNKTAIIMYCHCHHCLLLKRIKILMNRNISDKEYKIMIMVKK